MKKSSKRKLFISTITMSLAAILAAGGTYAWYSMGETADATGITLGTTAPSNMLIKSVYSATWNGNSTTVTDVAGGFTPSSTTNGKDFFAMAGNTYLGDAGTGGIVTDSDNTSVKFMTVGKHEDSGDYYAEFPLYIKASENVNATADYNIYLSKFTVTTASESNIEKTTRISITQVSPKTGDHETGEVFVQNDGTIRNSSGNTLTESNAVVYRYDTTTDVLPVSSLNTTAAKLNEAILATDDPAKEVNDTSTICMTVDYTATYYSTIIVRIWLEGQHDNCINAIIGEKISVEIGLKIVD